MNLAKGMTLRSQVAAHIDNKYIVFVMASIEALRSKARTEGAMPLLPYDLPDLASE